MTYWLLLAIWLSNGEVQRTAVWHQYHNFQECANKAEEAMKSTPPPELTLSCVEWHGPKVM